MTTIDDHASMSRALDESPDSSLVPVPADLAVRRPPAVVLDEARQAARALADVIEAKPHPIVINGERYLEFEDWLTVGRFYGVTARVERTEPVTFAEAHGFLAHAVAVRSDGHILSAADAMCLDNEARWTNKPLFQLRSMAQTRACAKALRNVLAWV